MSSICSVASIESDSPHGIRKTIHWLVPAHADTSINRLEEIVFVGMYCAESENKLFVPIPQTNTSSIGSPSEVKSKAIASALLGNWIGSQTIGGALDALPPSGVPDGRGKLLWRSGANSIAPVVKEMLREYDESK